MIMSFKQFLAWQRRKKRKPFDAGNIFIFAAADRAAARAAELLCEGGRTYELKKGYHCRFDRAHVPGQDDHLHVYLGRNQVCVINRDGTPSHNSVVDLPRHVRDDISALGLVDLGESVVSGADFTSLLVEGIGSDFLRELCSFADIQLLLARHAEGERHGRS